jgi:hypothetical protein
MAASISCMDAPMEPMETILEGIAAHETSW